MTGAAALFLGVGLFLVGGVYSFAKQGLPKGVVVLLGLASGLCLVAGALRLEV
ncbi:hypothetical protein [Streptomyces sp. NBC_01803]|uniref:hypothetical protein n=1 Tax=Streptomyces sp. NBC_01803 TaxID=2975946 RepID=UPI002DD83490|nr:hypothetical protein [Streptomyces sp. NBC_01803]WSA46683.1 hypothetical protein OIE51_22325 [Streptomyces sp. NBC_01803]